MTATALIVRYGEIGLKGRNRAHFENLLCDDIRRFLKNEGVDYRKVDRSRGRIYVRGVSGEAHLERVLGIHSFSPAREVSRRMEDIEAAAAEFYPQVRKAGTFRISCQRVDKGFPIISTEVERLLGERVRLDTGAAVKLTAPGFNLEVEIGRDAAFVFHQRIPGFGGMPYGSAGRLVSLISSGIDSPVATFLMMKRGVEPILLHFSLGGDDTAKVERLRQQLERYASGRSIRLEVLRHRDLFSQRFEELRKNRRIGPYLCIICKYLMHHRAGELAGQVGALGVVTGDSLAQVASQTLSNLAAYRTRSGLPVYSPLIGLDKVEIMALARKIGTYDLSIAAAQGCSPPSNPRTHVDPESFQTILAESGLDGSDDSFNP